MARIIVFLCFFVCFSVANHISICQASLSYLITHPHSSINSGTYLATKILENSVLLRKWIAPGSSKVESSHQSPSFLGTCLGCWECWSSCHAIVLVRFIPSIGHCGTSDHWGLLIPHALALSESRPYLPTFMNKKRLGGWLQNYEGWCLWAYQMDCRQFMTVWFSFFNYIYQLCIC